MSRTFGQKFREKRNSAHLTQDQIAEACGVTPAAISDWEKGKSLPTALNLVTAARFMHVSIDYLFGLPTLEAREPAGRYLSSHEFAALCARIDRLPTPARRLVADLVRLLENPPRAQSRE